ncbi:copper resistance D family protein [Shouchella clausii]|uniref:Copper resistance protein D domain-containing protein n=2 Tax=Shouchella clausii TaxID=79880 RepID=A0A268P2Q9_SHOCL|nr:copper resistance D family protein [Shouchella clausii]MDO7268034.1 copper resistance D family protein [Shouchella clausii]MDO7287914.1 copper resistance D family protein [Shouchella clausii]PAE90054.1 hypothetical protein CHH72_03470 [Shouchella clausii]
MIDAILNMLLYTLLAFTTGIFTVALAPGERGLRAEPKQQTAALMLGGIVVVLFGYVAKLAVTYADFFAISYLDALMTVIADHAVGASFLYGSLIVVLMAVVWLAMAKNTPLRPIAAGINLVFIVLLAFAISLSSHSASLNGLHGMISSSLHMVAMAFWIGPLLVIGLYGTSLINALKFHQWFSVVAVFSLLLLVTSGFIMMGEIAPEYVNSWMLSYGQLLLIKHILFIPLLVFGFRHLLSLSGKGAKLSPAERQKSFRAEGVIALLVFIVTSWLTETEPPHNVLRTLQNEPMSPLMDWFLQEPLLENQLISFSPGIGGVLLLVASAILLVGALVAAWWFKKTVIVGVLLVGWTLVTYSGLMISAGPGDIPVNLTVHDTIEEAIAVGRDNEQVELLAVFEEEQEEVFAVYQINERHLAAERLKVEDDGYRKYLDASVEIENGFLTGGDQFMDTFMFTTNDWVDNERASTYVSLGYADKDIESVEIELNGEWRDANVKNNVFIHVESTNETFPEAHRYLIKPINGKDLEVEKRQFIHEGHSH